MYCFVCVCHEYNISLVKRRFSGFLFCVFSLHVIKSFLVVWARLLPISPLALRTTRLFSCSLVGYFRHLGSIGAYFDHHVGTPTFCWPKYPHRGLKLKLLSFFSKKLNLSFSIDLVVFLETLLDLSLKTDNIRWSLFFCSFLQTKSHVSLLFDESQSSLFLLLWKDQKALKAWEVFAVKVTDTDFKC